VQKRAEGLTQAAGTTAAPPLACRFHLRQGRGRPIKTALRPPAAPRKFVVSFPASCGRKLMAIPNSRKQKAFTIAATALALICIGAWFGSTAKGAEKNDAPSFAANSTTAGVPSRSAVDDF